MSDQTANTNKKIDKEKTVRKRAARSIVAPRIEEEVSSKPSQKRETAYIPGTPRPPKPAKSAVTIVSPVPVNSEPGKKKAAKILSAPAGVIMNEDKLPPVEKKAAPKVSATGWPERPPQPRVKNGGSALGSALSQAQGSGTQAPATAKPSPQVTAGSQPANASVPPGNASSVPDRTQTIEVVNDPDGIPRRVIKTVVTTTTTTYESLTEDEIKNLKLQQTQPVSAPVRTAAQPAAAVQPAAKPGVIPEPVINRAAVAGGTKPAQPAGAAKPVQPVRTVQPGQTVQPVQPAQAAGAVQQTNLVQPVQAGQMLQPGQPIQAGQVLQPGQPAQPIQQTPPKPPMTAMDRQLAEIEKALGLSGDAVQGNAATPQTFNSPIPVNSQVPGVTPGQMPAGPAAAPTDPLDAQTKKSMEYLMLGVEALIFVIILCVCISIYQKIKNKGYAGDDNAQTTYESDAADTGSETDDSDGTESFDVQQAGAGDELLAGNSDLAEEDILADTPASEPSDSVDVDNEQFTLQCTNVTVTLDTEGNPTALIYFSFTNKTSDQMSMSEVFPASVTQNGETCDQSSALQEFPEEFYNKDMKISDGSTLNCCYAFTLKDAVSPIRLTVHDNYQSFSDVGTTEIAIQ